MAGVTPIFGTGSLGSLVGTAVSGGAGDGDGTSGLGGGGGGGLTSIRQTGSVTAQFSIPAGGGGGTDAFAPNPAGSGGDGSSGGGADVDGDSSMSGEGGGGGGAGEPGGTAGSFAMDAAGGAFGALPSGLMSLASFDGSVVTGSAADYALCTTRTSANSSEPGGMATTYGGDGCVVIRCVP